MLAQASGAPRTAGEARWLLLIHQLPPRPAYLRVRVGRRLQGLGAVALKNTVYALPRNEAAREDLAWVLREIAEAGGEAVLVAATLLEGLRDEDVEGLFQAARSADYARISERARKLASTFRGKRGASSVPPRAAAELRRLEEQLAGAIALDFFEAPGREAAEGRIEAIAARVRAAAAPEGESSAPSRSRPDPRQIAGGTWVTRRGVHVDRIACAWLIRGFLDSQARFMFVAPREYQPRPGEIRFDMYEAEFTHDGDRCTFEVLLDEAGIKDPALRAIGEVVHDIDLKDEKFGRPETAGVARLIAGLARRTRDDRERIERGGQLFADLYESFPRRGGGKP
jgi:hypothetical protein